jgi:hypothetical protein
VFENIEEMFWKSKTGNQFVTIMKSDSFRITDSKKSRLERPSQIFLTDVINQSEYSKKNEEKNDAVGQLLSAWLKKKKRLNITQWEPNKTQYPKFMLLGTDKGILAYVETFYHHSEEKVDDEVVCRYGICHRMDDLRSRLAVVDSDLDRPVFYIHFLDYPDQKGIFFETTEMIKNNIYEESGCVDLETSKKLYFSNLSEMGDFEELILMFEDLKKNNVKFY